MDEDSYGGNHTGQSNEDSTPIVPGLQQEQSMDSQHTASTRAKDKNNKPRYWPELDLYSRAMILLTLGLLIVGGWTVVIFMGQLDLMQDSVDAANRSVQESQRLGGVAAKQLEITERPWVTYEIAVIRPLEFKNGYANLHLRFLLTNVGHSVTTGINVWTQLFALPVTKKDSFHEPVKLQANFCDEVRQDTVDPGRAGSTLFPDQQLPVDVAVSIGKEEIDSSLIPFEDRVGKYIAPILIGCVDYQFASSAIHHQTGFIYEILRYNSV